MLSRARPSIDVLGCMQMSGMQYYDDYGELRSSRLEPQRTLRPMEAGHGIVKMVALLDRILGQGTLALVLRTWYTVFSLDDIDLFYSPGTIILLLIRSGKELSWMVSFITVSKIIIFSLYVSAITPNLQ